MSRLELAKIPALTFYKDSFTEARRTEPIPQLVCVGKPCKLYQVRKHRIPSVHSFGLNIATSPRSSDASHLGVLAQKSTGRCVRHSVRVTRSADHVRGFSVKPTFLQVCALDGSKLGAKVWTEGLSEPAISHGAGWSRPGDRYVLKGAFIDSSSLSPHHQSRFMCA
jgi:hypothetical protein